MKSKIELTKENVQKCLELQLLTYNKFINPPPYYPQEPVTNPDTHEEELKRKNITYLIETIHELEFKILKIK